MGKCILNEVIELVLNIFGRHMLSLFPFFFLPRTQLVARVGGLEVIYIDMIDILIFKLKVTSRW